MAAVGLYKRRRWPSCRAVRQHGEQGLGLRCWAPRARALGLQSALTRGMSTQRRQGLVGDSEKNRDTCRHGGNRDNSKAYGVVMGRWLLLHMPDLPSSP